MYGPKKKITQVPLISAELYRTMISLKGKTILVVDDEPGYWELYNIIEDHQGRLYHDGASPHTRFVIELPFALAMNGKDVAWNQPLTQIS